jgi:DMSO/TMAO reductase YedYZ molybdopterin-dependent catalytic subunit
MKEIRASRGIGLGAGLFVAAMVTASLIAILFLGWRVVGLPFAPFDIFDWTTRVLPGRVIGLGIGTMVAVIGALHLGPTAETAKMAEQAMAIIGLFVTGLVVGTILFAVVRAVRGRYADGLGLVFGLVVGLPVALISHSVGQTAATPPIANALWIVAVFLIWGLVLGRASRRLIQATGTATVSVQEGDEAAASVERIDRRRFLVRLGGATAAITVVGAVVGELAEAKRRKMMSTVGTRGRWSATNALPNAGAAVKPVPGTRPEFTPLERHYRIDINTIPPAVNEEQWRLNITGLVEKPLALTLDELRRYEPLHQFITLRCISNPVGGDLIGTTRWTGVSLQRLLPDLRLKPGASHLKMHAADGFFEVVPIETIKADERVMLTYAWDGVPLLTEHGFPLRIYIPNVCGMKQPKWITAIEVIGDWEPGYWVVRGWNKEAVMEATSVIDVVGMDMDIIQADQRKMIVPIGGIAHTGARGVSKVELQVDNGPWQPALLRTPLSHLTWVIWRYEWPFQHGNHTFTVRCWDGQGVPQIVAQAPPEPNGATGLDSKTQMF